MRKLMIACVLAGSVVASQARAEPGVKDITWTLGKPLPELRKGGAVGVFEGKLISAAGMRHPWLESPVVYQYDARADAWSKLPDMPKGRVYVDGVSLPDAFVTIGGRREGQTLAEVRCLARRTGKLQWRYLPPMPTDRGWAAMDAWRTCLICAGGNRFSKGQAPFTEKTTCHAVEMFDTAAPGTGWRKLPDIPGDSRGWVAGAVVDDAFYLFGGLHFRIVDGMRQNYRLPETLRLDLKSKTWSKRADMPYPLSGHDAVAFADRYVIIVGGAPDWTEAENRRYGRKPDQYSNVVLVYDTQADRWSILPSPMPYGTNDIRAAIIGKTIYALGGENIHTPTSNTTNYLRVGRIVTEDH